MDCFSLVILECDMESCISIWQYCSLAQWGATDIKLRLKLFVLTDSSATRWALQGGLQNRRCYQGSGQIFQNEDWWWIQDQHVRPLFWTGTAFSFSRPGFPLYGIGIFICVNVSSDTHNCAAFQNMNFTKCLLYTSRSSRCFIGVFSSRSRLVG